MNAPWFACEEPERPTDAAVLWHYAYGDDCRGCRLKAEMVLRQWPDDTHVQWLAARLGAGEHGKAQQ
jgi:hypothetical protein